MESAVTQYHIDDGQWMETYTIGVIALDPRQNTDNHQYKNVSVHLMVHLIISLC